MSSEIKYYIKSDFFEEKEVSKEEYMKAEKIAGFYSKFENEPATSSFGCSKTTLQGRLKYVR